MRRYLLQITGLILLSLNLFAQQTDSLFAEQDGKAWMLRHTVKSQETIFTIARQYHVPPAMLATVNRVSYQTTLPTGSRLVVPVGAYNFINTPPSSTTDILPVYHIVTADDNLYRIARNSGVQQKTIQQWNDLEYLQPEEGTVLLIGWLRYDATKPENIKKKKNLTVVYDDTPMPSQAKNKVPLPDKKENITRPGSPKQQASLMPHTVTKKEIPDIAVTTSPEGSPQDSTYIVRQAASETEQQYLDQTFNEQSVTEEKGPAAFYDATGGINSEVHYAFHNTAGRGRIIRVTNPGNGKYVFVKVLGPLPKTKLYHNCIIGISSTAKEVLGVMGDKIWCSLHYAP